MGKLPIFLPNFTFTPPGSPQPGGGTNSTRRGAKRSQHQWNEGIADPSMPLLHVQERSEIQEMWCWGGGREVGGFSAPNRAAHQCTTTIGVMFIFMGYETNKMRTLQKKTASTSVTTRRVCRKLGKKRQLTKVCCPDNCAHSQTEQMQPSISVMGLSFFPSSFSNSEMSLFPSTHNTNPLEVISFYQHGLCFSLGMEDF